MLGPGQTLGRYRVEATLGSGGMGEVFRAWDTTLRRWVALKVVARDATGRAERLLGEARSVAALKHPNVVSVFDVGEVDGLAFVSMDLVEGKTLRAYIGDRAVGSETQQAWLLQIASALSVAHRAGLVHRDVKPENVMIGADGEAHVLDFGLAKSFGIDVQGPTQHGGESGPPSFRTGEGRIVGTPAYMAPEQLAGAPPSPAWDQYAWGVLAFELVTGLHPRLAGLISVNRWVKPADSVATVSPGLTEIVSQAMAPSPEQRFPTMDEIVLALGGTVSGGASAQPHAVARSLPPAATSKAPLSPSGGAPLGKHGYAVGDTLPTAVHPPVAARSARSARWVTPVLVVVAMLGLLVGGVGLGASWRARGDAAPVPSTITSTAAASATALGATASVAAPAMSASSAAPQATRPPALAAASASPPKAARAPRKKPVTTMNVGTSLQYDEPTARRFLKPVLPLVRSCIEEHTPRTLPATIGVTLELWSIGDEVGKVRAVNVSEPEALQACLRDAFMPVSFGPPKQAAIPPGAVFVSLFVEP